MAQLSEVDLDLAPENLLDLLLHPQPPYVALRCDGADVRSAADLRSRAIEWVGPRTRLIRADKVRDPRSKRLTIWQLLGPLHKGTNHAVLRRRAVEAGVEPAALRTAARAARPAEAILQLHIELLAGAESARIAGRSSGLQELCRDLAAVQLEARTSGHYLLVCATSAPAGIEIQCLEGLAASGAAFQQRVAQEVARQLEQQPPGQSPDAADNAAGRLGDASARYPTVPTAGGEAHAEARLPPHELPVTTLAQRIVDLDVAIKAAKDASKKEALREQQHALQRRLVELHAGLRPGEAPRAAPPWARGLEEPPEEQKHHRDGGVVLVYSHEQQVRLGVTEMGDPLPGEPRDGCSAAKRMFDKHAASMTRIRQLAEAEPLAMALEGSRFNSGGLEAEREEARGWLQQWARIGWDVRKAVELMWQGKRDSSQLARACKDGLARPLMQLILDADIGQVKRQPEFDAPARGSAGGAREAHEQLALTAAAVSRAARPDGIARSALHSPSAFIPSPPSSRRSQQRPGQGAAASSYKSNETGDRSRRSLRSKDLRNRISDDLGCTDGSQAAKQALLAAEETINTARGMAPMLSEDDIRRNIRRPELRLAQAVARRDHATVVQLLQAGANLEACDPLQPGWTPLHQAAQHGDLEILRLLIHHGASPDAVDDLTGTTPFLWACYCGHADCVKEMLQDGDPTPSSQQMNWSIAGPNAHRHLTKDDVGRTGLQIARLNRHHEVVEVLLMHEAQLKTEEKRKRWYYMSRQQQQTLAEDYGVQGPPLSEAPG